MLERTLTIAPPFDLGRTTRALGVGERDDRGTWWWTTICPSGTATISLGASGGAVVAQAWGDGAEELAERVPRLVGLDDRTRIEAIDERSRRLLRSMSGVRLGSSAAVHEALISGVLGQMVTTTEAHRSERQLRRRYGAPAPGPRPQMRAAPRPEVLADLAPHALHDIGIEGRRAEILIEVARRARRLAEIIDLPVGEAWARLEAIRGIGPWTAAHVMGAAYGDRDAVPIGDYHLPDSVSYALAGEDRGTDDRMVELLEPFRPERRRMVVAIKQAGIVAPRRGPRTPVRRHL